MSSDCKEDCRPYMGVWGEGWGPVPANRNMIQNLNSHRDEHLRNHLREITQCADRAKHVLLVDGINIVGSWICQK
jgi:hypothetical protein